MDPALGPVLVQFQYYTVPRDGVFVPTPLSMDVAPSRVTTNFHATTSCGRLRSQDAWTCS
jgi:hypothetical protein